MRFLRPFEREDGIALVVAIGVLTVLTIGGTTAAYYTTKTSQSASASHDDTLAFVYAEAGLNDALAVLSNQPANDPMDPNLLAERTEYFEDGRVVWSGTLDQVNAKWHITSVGYSKNPTGPAAAEINRTLTAKVPIRPLTTQPLAVSSWNYVYSYGTGSPCDMTLDSSVEINTRVMAAGNFCMQSSSRLTGGELLVGGQTKVFSSALIGSSSSPMTRVDSANGCKYESNPAHNPCQGPPGNADKVWATTITSSPAIEPAPTVDLDSWYVKASPGPYKPCVNPTGTPPTFDNDQGSTPDPTKRNRSVSGSFNLTPSSSYTCRTYLGSEILGEISWNNSTKVLTVKGTIFIDGNARIGQNGSYTGQATIYLSGSFLIDGFRMCAVVSGSSCDFSSGAWDPNARLLAIVANGVAGQSGVDTGESVALLSSAMWQGAIYGGTYKIEVDGSLVFAGPLIADEVHLNSSIDAMPFTMIGTSPSGLPGNQAIYAKPDKLELFSG
jgi:hypothetical protein